MTSDVLGVFLRVMGKACASRDLNFASLSEVKLLTNFNSF